MKKTLCVLLSLCLLVGLTACLEQQEESSKTLARVDADGVYYAYEEGEIDQHSYIRLKGSRYGILATEIGGSDSVELSGSFEITTDGSITFFYKPDVMTEFGRLLVDEYGWKDGERGELFSGTYETGKITLTGMLGAKRPEPLVFYLDGKLPEDVAGDFDGTYQRYAEGEFDEDGSLRLRKGSYKLKDGDLTFSGSFEVTAGRIVLWYEIDGERELDRSLMDAYDYTDGEKIELFSGRIEGGKVTLTEAHGERQFPEEVYYLDGVLPEQDGVLYDGAYLLCEDGEVYDDYYIRLKGRKYELKQGYSLELSGWFEVNGSAIAFWYAIEGNSTLDQGLIAQGYKKGQTIEMFSGRIAEGKITLTDALGNTQSAEEVYYLNGEVS